MGHQAKNIMETLERSGKNARVILRLMQIGTAVGVLVGVASTVNVESLNPTQSLYWVNMVISAAVDAGIGMISGCVSGVAIAVGRNTVAGISNLLERHKERRESKEQNQRDMQKSKAEETDRVEILDQYSEIFKPSFLERLEKKSPPWLKRRLRNARIAVENYEWDQKSPAEQRKIESAILENILKESNESKNPSTEFNKQDLPIWQRSISSKSGVSQT